MKYYVVDSFSDELFKGNPAGVCVDEEDLPADLMRKIAFENDLSETAFLTIKDGKERLRWFTPREEIGLCGHATLAAAHVAFEYLGSERYVEFLTAAGALRAERVGVGQYEICLPARDLRPDRSLLDKLKSVGIEAEEAFTAVDVIAVVGSEDAVRSYTPDYDAMYAEFGTTGVVIAANGETTDIVSRYFCPELKREDAVTGSSHCALVPMWAKRFGRTEFEAEQLSERGGKLSCRLEDGSVFLRGRARTYMVGEILASDTDL